MARPKIGNSVVDITLSLKESNHEFLRRLEREMKLSKSEIVDRLLVAEMAGDESIVAKFPRLFVGHKRPPRKATPRTRKAA